MSRTPDPPTVPSGPILVSADVRLYYTPGSDGQKVICYACPLRRGYNTTMPADRSAEHIRAHTAAGHRTGES